MATAHPLPALAGEGSRKPALAGEGSGKPALTGEGSGNPAATAGGSEPAPGQALVPVSQPLAEDEAMALSTPLARLLVELDVVVPVRGFRVRNLLALDAGQLIESQWAHEEDMPLAAGEVQLAWSEFEVVDSELAVRITRLA